MLQGKCGWRSKRSAGGRQGGEDKEHEGERLASTRHITLEYDEFALFSCFSSAWMCECERVRGE